MDEMRTVRQHEQVACLSDANRLLVLRRLMIKPATISQIGASIGKHPAWVRHHVLKLIEAGLVELSEVRVVRNYTEKYYRACAGSFAAHLLVIPGEAEPGSEIVVAGSNDLALDLLVEATPASHLRTIATGSLDGLVALRQGLADAAACHLFDEVENEYNLPYVRHLFPDRNVVVRTLVHREQGIVTAPGNPLGLSAIEDVALDGVRFANRIKGSGTRVWLDNRLRAAGITAEDVTGYDIELATHSAIAEHIAAGEADAGIAVRAVAEKLGLGFVPLFRERFDLVVLADALSDERVERALESLATPAFRRQAERLPGYDVEGNGLDLAVTA